MNRKSENDYTALGGEHEAEARSRRRKYCVEPREGRNGWTEDCEEVGPDLPAGRKPEGITYIVEGNRAKVLAEAIRVCREIKLIEKKQFVGARYCGNGRRAESIAGGSQPGSRETVRG